MGAELSVKLGLKKKAPKAGSARGEAFGQNVRWVNKSGEPFTEKQMEAFGAQRMLSGGCHAQSIWRLPGPNGAVEKRFGKGQDAQERFDIEVKILRRLQTCDFVPKLLDVDEKNRIIRMTFCGTKPKESLKLRKTVHHHLKTLEENYGVYRKENIGKKQYKVGGTGGNVVTDGERVFIIDFGSPNWHLKD